MYYNELQNKRAEEKGGGTNESKNTPTTKQNKTKKRSNRERCEREIHHRVAYGTFQGLVA